MTRVAGVGTGFSRLRHLVREAQDVAADSAPGTIAGGAADSAGALATSSPAGLAAPSGDLCDLCGASLPEEHRHIYEATRDRIHCACRGCTILFDRSEAGGGHYRLVPERVVALPDFELDDLLWERFDIPVDLAFCRRMDGDEHIIIQYPGALGAVNSRVEPGAWAELEARNPVLRTLEPGVEALLINQAAGAREYWIAPLDLCFELVGLIRRHWKGLGGGEVVWEEVARFFGELREKNRK